MALLTKWGSQWGFLPLTTGRYIWVAPSADYYIEGVSLSASDDNSGLHPEQALRTVQAAVTLSIASSGDVIVLLPGNHSSALTITPKTGTTVTGIPGGRPSFAVRGPQGGKRLKTTVTNTGTAGIIFTVSATDVEISHLELRPAAAGGRGVSVAATGDRAYVHDCSLVMQSTASVTTYGVTFPAGVTGDVTADVVVRNCYFLSGVPGASGANGGGVSVLTTCHGLTIEQSTFELQGTAAWATGILASSPGTLGLLIRDNDFVNPTSATTVITTAVNTTSQTVDGSTRMLRNYVHAGTDAATSSAIADIAMSENYLAAVATNGGALADNL